MTKQIFRKKLLKMYKNNKNLNITFTDTNIIIIIYIAKYSVC